MKLSKSQLKRLIKEELRIILNEQVGGGGGDDPEHQQTQAPEGAVTAYSKQYKSQAMSPYAHKSIMKAYAFNMKCGGCVDAVVKLEKKGIDTEKAWLDARSSAHRGGDPESVGPAPGL